MFSLFTMFHFKNLSFCEDLGKLINLFNDYQIKNNKKLPKLYIFARKNNHPPLKGIAN